jgi:transposase-like protein
MKNAERIGSGVPSTLDGDPEAPLTVAAVAARLGVAPSTLRTWDRRYGLGPSGRAAGSHRRYTASDVARLETMRRLTLAGAAPSDAARVAASTAPKLVALAAPESSPAPPETPVFVDALTLAAAAANGEEPRVRRMIAWVVRERGVIGAWTEIAQPALAVLAGRELPDRPGRDPETTLAGAVLAAARGRADDAPAPERGPVSVLLVADEARPEAHLGAHVLAAALAERGVGARVLRASDDPARVLRALDSPGVAVLALVGDPCCGPQLAGEAAERPDVAVFMIGSQVPDVWLPGVQRVRTYEGAVHELAGALG